MATTRVDEAYNPKVKSICGLDIQSSFDLDVEKCGVGGRIWKAAIAFVDMIEKYDMTFKDKTVIEIGAGTGLSGLAIGMKQPQKVVITDVDPGCVETIKLNLEINKDKVDKDSIDVKELNFGDKEALQKIIKEYPEGFDYVIGTDIVYGTYLIPLIITALDNLAFKEGCQIMIALSTIFPEVALFLDELKSTGRYLIREYDAGELDDMYYKVKVFFIKPKKKE